MLGLLWFLQRKVARGPRRKQVSEQITVVGRQGLGAKAQLVIVETGEVRYVLGVSEHGVTVLDRLPAAAPVADTASTPLTALTPRAGSFERALTASATEEFTPPIRMRVRHRSDPLRGSILSPQTWRQTSEAIRRIR